jgi:sialic acid synthase SpsE
MTLVQELRWRGMIQDIMPGTEELLNKPFVRKGIYAKRDIKEGELLKPEDLICLRPAQGRPASDWHFIANTPALKAYKAYEPI